MQNQEDLYLSFDFNDYKQGKTFLLNTEINILNTIKRLNRIRRLKYQKNKLKIQLCDKISLILEKLENLEDNYLPNPDFGELKEEIDYSIGEYDNSKHISIEKELREIQQKLKKLNR